MTGFITIFFALVALFLQFSLGQVLSLWGVPPPIFTAVVLWRSWHMKKGVRPFWGILCGFLLDSITAGPPGTYTLTLFILVLLVNLWQSIFADRDSRLTHTAGMGILLFLYGVLATIFDVVMPYILRGVRFPLLWGPGIAFPLLAAFFWATAFFLWLFIVAMLRWRKK